MNVRRPLTALLAAVPRQPGQTALLALDGRGGSGKSTLARALQAADPAALIVQLDDFFKPSRERPPEIGRAKPIGGDYDIARLRAQVIDPLLRGESGRYARYDWPTNALAEWHTLVPGTLVIIEGIYALLPELRRDYTFRVWVDCPYDIRLMRGLARDGESARARWVEDWMPSEDRYVEVCHPQQAADRLVDGSGRFSHDPNQEFVEITAQDRNQA
jgi:uridine kinase